MQVYILTLLYCLLLYTYFKMAVQIDQFCWIARAFLTLMIVNPRNVDYMKCPYKFS